MFYLIVCKSIEYKFFISRCSNITFKNAFPHYIVWSWACSTVLLPAMHRVLGLAELPFLWHWLCPSLSMLWSLKAAQSSAFVLCGARWLFSCLLSMYILNCFSLVQNNFLSVLLRLCCVYRPSQKPNPWATSQLWSDLKNTSGHPWRLGLFSLCSLGRGCPLSVPCLSHRPISISSHLTFLKSCFYFNPAT